MARSTLNPADYGLALSRQEFLTILGTKFSSHFNDEMTVDELLVKPKEAIKFCILIRAIFCEESLSDEVILKALVNLRKSGKLKQP